MNSILTSKPKKPTALILTLPNFRQQRGQPYQGRAQTKFPGFTVAQLVEHSNGAGLENIFKLGIDKRRGCVV
jgi:hypothetical protein